MFTWLLFMLLVLIPVATVACWYWKRQTPTDVVQKVAHGEPACLCIADEGEAFSEKCQRECYLGSVSSGNENVVVHDNRAMTLLFGKKGENHNIWNELHPLKPSDVDAPFLTNVKDKNQATEKIKEFYETKTKRPMLVCK